MNRQYPIYTEERDCRDCYKCVRRCPVKAIKIENGRATVMADRCIACGICVHTCPAGAKKVRNDLYRAKSLLQRNPKTIASIAPSFASEWPNLSAEQLAGAVKKLGFYAVSETALGAEAVTAALAHDLREARAGLHISTACPVVVDHIRKYAPRFADNLTPMLSPMQNHAHLLKQHYGADAAVVFIGPCIAKKCECDEQVGETDLALTFCDLALWMDEAGIDPAQTEPAAMEPTKSAHGALYPIAGGMNRTLEDYDLPNVELLAASGMDTIVKTLENLDTDSLKVPVFLEALACPGGCVAGPQINETRPILASELAVRRTALPGLPETEPAETVEFKFVATPPSEEIPQEDRIRKALRRVGKYKRDDELNCGGCGYETCRNFAEALLTHKAEPDMCLSYLRNRAMKKANALLRCMPSGVVIVDRSLRIIECNENFARTAGSDTLLGYTAKPGLEGADLRKILPFANLFEEVNRTGSEFHSDSLRWENRLLNVTLFPIETGQDDRRHYSRCYPDRNPARNDCEESEGGH